MSVVGILSSFAYYEWSLSSKCGGKDNEVGPNNSEVEFYGVRNPMKNFERATINKMCDFFKKKGGGKK